MQTREGYVLKGHAMSNIEVEIGVKNMNDGLVVGVGRLEHPFNVVSIRRHWSKRWHVST